MSQIQPFFQTGLDALLIATVGIASITDIQTRRIPNWLTFGAAVAGLAMNASMHGLAGIWLSLGGWLLGVALLIIPFLLHGIGAGDVKLLAAIGAVKGPAFVLTCGLASAIVGGLIATMLLMRQRRLGIVLIDLAVLRWNTALASATQGSQGSFAYGLAIAAGSLIALGLSHG